MKKVTVKLTPKDKHLALLAQAYFENLTYQENGYGGQTVIGHVGVDFKRPFGNKDVTGDILEIIGTEMEGDNGDEPCWSSKQNAYAVELLKALPEFLQAMFAKGKHTRTWQSVVGRPCPKCSER